MIFSSFFEGGDLSGEGGVVARDLVGPARCGGGLARLPREDDDDPGRYERGDDPADPPARDPGDRQARQINRFGFVG